MKKQLNGNQLLVFSISVMMNECKNNVIPIKKNIQSDHFCNQTDDELMQLASANYRRAFEEIVKRYQGPVRGFCQKWHGQNNDDLAQEIFIRLWNARQQYKSKGEFRSYLFTIVINCCRNAKRSQHRKPAMEEFTAEHLPSVPASDQLDEILKQEKMERVHGEIQKLSPKLKEALLLRFGQEMNYKQIATITGKKQETIRSRVLLALNKLKAEL